MEGSCFSPSFLFPSRGGKAKPNTASESLSNGDSNSGGGSQMQKLVALVGDDTLNFIKAKEEFKKSLTFSGVLYRYIYNT